MNYDEMNKGELIKYARENGIKVWTTWTKAKLISAIDTAEHISKPVKAEKAKKKPGPKPKKTEEVVRKIADSKVVNNNMKKVVDSFDHIGQHLIDRNIVISRMEYEYDKENIHKRIGNCYNTITDHIVDHDGFADKNHKHEEHDHSNIVGCIVVVWIVALIGWFI